MKILIGTDFSKASENAIEYTTQIARNFIAEVVLVHSYLPPMVDPSIPVGMLEANEMTVIKEFDEILEKKVRKLRESGVRASYKVVIGDLRHAFDEVTKDTEPADLIVLGKTENPDFLDKLIGSTSQHLLNQVQVPLLVVPENYPVTLPKAFAYATQLEFEESGIIKKVKEMSGRLKSKLHFVKVQLDNDLDINPDLPLIKEINGITGLEKTEVDYVNAESLKEGLSAYIKDHDISLLVLASHKRGLLDGILAPSQSRKLLSKIKIPVLIYHFT